MKTTLLTKLLLTFTLTLFSTSTFASSDPRCEDLKISEYFSCISSRVVCQSLGACLYKRKTCPDAVKSEKGCNSFNRCMSDGESLRDNKPDRFSGFHFAFQCQYSWTKAKGCQLADFRTTDTSFLTAHACPGQKYPEEKNENFNCEVNRKIARFYYKECVADHALYVKTCFDDPSYEDMTEGTSCIDLNTKLAP